MREGDQPTVINLFLDGWGRRYKDLPDGRRQVVSFFVPGDLCDLNIFILRQMDHSIGALTPLTIAEIPRSAFEEIIDRHPRITQALWWEALVAAATQREWTMSLGQRNAAERIGHLLCELFLRLRTVGLTNGTSCPFPLTQSVLGEATGLSLVHVNRTLQDYRAAGMIVLKQRELTIPDLRALMEASMFDANYLHLDHEGRHFDANI
ncbi:cAMP-binding domain of CRP or a regulatory subunit of cAMP-dependent protein kinases [Consotaella salsifontis]|uniref:cAMP-binding domain of CRP or a regulatory subunit of cAMP-dependent protein kinases n=1 Tax=Consotaella salsifontis TaxID=1365950 RepID=A0A1T4SFD9_9HYPH|nr:cAMP-binding domain of CRP or a regulatory subunit of cAMP-dependent protein kinases [Consotaella salsifontis]